MRNWASTRGSKQRKQTEENIANHKAPERSLSESLAYSSTRGHGTEQLSVTTPQLSLLGKQLIVLDAGTPTTAIVKRQELEQDDRSLRGGEGMRRVNTSGFLQRQQQQRLSISHWLRWSLEEASSSCCSHSGAPCVASLPPLMNSTTGVVGLWELPGLSLLRHYNMLNSPQRLPDWHQCLVWTVQSGPVQAKSTMRLDKEWEASAHCRGNVAWCSTSLLWNCKAAIPIGISHIFTSIHFF